MTKTDTNVKLLSEDVWRAKRMKIAIHEGNYVILFFIIWPS